MIKMLGEVDFSKSETTGCTTFAKVEGVEEVWVVVTITKVKKGTDPARLAPLVYFGNDYPLFIHPYDDKFPLRFPLRPTYEGGAFCIHLGGVVEEFGIWWEKRVKTGHMKIEVVYKEEDKR